jgi:NAD+ kinase
VSALEAIRRCGVCYHPDVPGAAELAARLHDQVGAGGHEVWLAPLERDGAGPPDGGPVAAQLPGSNLLVCVGGDGTVLQASGLAAPFDVPVFGVRMGRLGFLAEATGDDAGGALGRILEGEGRIEERAMAQAEIVNADGEAAALHALNDVVIGRNHLGRTVSVGLSVDGVLLAEYRADAVVVATATGSTGYSLATNGPILYPTSPELIVVAVAPHLSYGNALVMRGDAEVKLQIARGHEAVMTVDGHHEREVPSGTVVRVTRSPRVARFVRLGSEHQFYANLARRLGWLRLDHSLDDVLDEVDERES